MTADPTPTAVEALRLAAAEIDRWSLVIESAVRHDAPREHKAVLDALKANCSALDDFQLHGGGESRSSLPPVALHETSVEWQASQGGYLRESIIYEVSDYDAGDPCLELAESHQGHFDLVISRGGNDCTLDKISPLMLGKIGRLLVAASQQASMGGSELKPETPTLQGPTREEVARIIDPSAWRIATLQRLEDRKTSLSKADAILALLKPTSPSDRP